MGPKSRSASVWRALALMLAAWVWLIRVEAAPAERSPVMSFVLVAEPRLPAAKPFRDEVEKRLRGRLVIDDMEADGKEVILLRIAGGTVMVGLIDAPLPAGQIDDLCAGAWYWRQACAATSAHRAHVVVTWMGSGLDTMDAHLLITDVVAALMDANAIASYWRASLQSREAFLRQSATINRASPPAWLWVNFRVSIDKERGLSLSTDGMEAFGLREIEAKDVKRPGMDVFVLLLGMAQYLMSQGPVIQDGETIGESPALNIRVRQGPSYWREGVTVYRVTWP